jgi:hypothetical protein
MLLLRWAMPVVRQPLDTFVHEKKKKRIKDTGAELEMYAFGRVRHYVLRKTLPLIPPCWFFMLFV